MVLPVICGLLDNVGFCFDKIAVHTYAAVSVKAHSPYRCIYNENLEVSTGTQSQAFMHIWLPRKQSCAFWLPQDVTVKSNFAQEWNERQTTLLALQLLHHKRCEIFVGQKAFSTPEGSSRQAILLHLLSLVQWLQQKCTEQQHDRNHREVMAEVTAERGRMGAVFLTLPLAWRFIRFGPHSRPPFDEIQYLDVWLSILEC